MGYSRDSCYRFRERYHESGEAALHEISGRKPALKNRVAAVLPVGFGLPHLRQRRARAAPQSPQNFFRADSRYFGECIGSAVIRTITDLSHLLLRRRRLSQAGAEAWHTDLHRRNELTSAKSVMFPGIVAR